MQQLSKRRLTNTPWDVPQVPCNCGLSLNSSEGRNSVAGLKTFDNNSDVALTPKGENMQIYVLNQKGKSLMPCSPRKARLLLKQNKAKVVKRTPFTIQFTIPTRSYTQAVTLGVDSGYLNVGLSAVTDKEELYSSEVKLRTDIVQLNSERRQYCIFLYPISQKTFFLLFYQIVVFVFVLLSPTIGKALQQRV